MNGFFDTDLHSVSWTKNPLGIRASWVAKCQLTSWRSVPKKPRTWVFIIHDEVIKWKHFPRNWPFVREIHRSPVNFPHKGQWRGALMFSLIYAWINDWVNNREAGDLIRQHGHYDVIVMRIPLQHPVQPTQFIHVHHVLNGSQTSYKFSSGLWVNTSIFRSKWGISAKRFLPWFIFNPFIGDISMWLVFYFLN